MKSQTLCLTEMHTDMVGYNSRTSKVRVGEAISEVSCPLGLCETLGSVPSTTKNTQHNTQEMLGNGSQVYGFLLGRAYRIFHDQ